MTIVEDALDAAPPWWASWLAARSVVRRTVCRLVARGVESTGILVVIADHGTVLAEVIQVVCPEVVVQVGEPLVAMFVGEHRRLVAAVLGGVEAYLAIVPPGSFVAVTAPAGAKPMAATVRVVDRRQLS